MLHTWIAVASHRIERTGEVDENIADNDSEYNEILDAAIMYKTDGTYPSNSYIAHHSDEKKMTHV